MAMPAKIEYAEELVKNQIEIRNMVLQGINQARQGNVKDFEEVCDRLEKKYKNAQI